VTEGSSPGPTYCVINPVSGWSQQKVSNPPTQVSTRAPAAAAPEHATELVDTGRHALRAFGTKRHVAISSIDTLFIPTLRCDAAASGPR
jgi:hypothetical protein